MGEWLVFFLDHMFNRSKKYETYPMFMSGSVFDLKTPPRPLGAADPKDQEDEAEGVQPSAHSADIVGGAEVPRAPIIDYIKKARGSIHPPPQVQKNVLERCHTSSL